MPKPVQSGGVPIWVSGTVNDAVMRRLARFGSGWIPWGDDAADLADAIPRVRERVRALGRDPSDLRVVGGLPRDGIDRVPEMVEQGVTDFRAHVPLDELADVVASFRRAVGRAGREL
jgi:alkanesulfonate monooxygenase SsuD/methylene tetrahydromethanopterin reductase-like flavin-dependent oxidoreductase (luciferase family)